MNEQRRQYLRGDLSARGKRVLRRGGIRAGQGARLSHQHPGEAKPVRRQADTKDAGQHRGLSRLLPARHHHGVARPRLGRRAHRRGAAASGADAAWHAGVGAALRLVPDRLFALLFAAHRHRRAGAENPGDPRPEPVSLWVAYPLHASFMLFYPLNWLLNSASRAVLRLFRVGDVAHKEILSGPETCENLVETSARARRHSGRARPSTSRTSSASASSKCPT